MPAVAAPMSACAWPPTRATASSPRRASKSAASRPGADRQRRLQLGPLPAQQPQRARDRRAGCSAISWRRLPGSTASTGRRGIEAVRREERARVGGGPHELDQRMAHERHAHAGLAIERLLEREDHHHVRHVARARRACGRGARPRAGARRSTRPGCRAGERARQAQVEAGVVDEHRERRGARGPPRRAPARNTARRRRRWRSTSTRPTTASSRTWAEEPRSLACKPVAAEPEHLEVRDPLAQVPHQLARVEVARRLAARDEEPAPRRGAGRPWSRERAVYR